MKRKEKIRGYNKRKADKRREWEKVGKVSQGEEEEEGTERKKESKRGEAGAEGRGGGRR